MAKISKSKAQVLFYHVLLKTNRNLNSIFQTQKSSKQNGSSNSVFLDVIGKGNTKMKV